MRCSIHCPQPDRGSGLLMAVATGGAVLGVTLFVIEYAVVLAVAAGTTLAVMGGVVVWFRWLGSPKRLERHLPAIRASVARALAGPPPEQWSEPWRVVSIEKVPDTAVRGTMPR